MSCRCPLICCPFRSLLISLCLLICCPCRCPLICLLSPGADPTKLIEDLAKKKKIKTLGVSMGQVGGWVRC